eukprot:jgi/Chrzof1/9179/Cz03g38260.t1
MGSDCWPPATLWYWYQQPQKDVINLPPVQVQNKIDDVAMTFERLRAMVTGQDPLATALFFWRCLLIATALYLVGPGWLVFVWWCWDILRPPSWRGPPGVKGPLQFLVNLPSRSTEDL